MGVSLTDHVAGDVMSWSAVAANLATFRSWINAVPLADIATGQIEREHLVRPRLLQFPVQAIQSGFQTVFWQTYGNPIPSALQRAEWGSRAERLLIKPYRLPAGTDRWYTPISRTVHFPRDVDVDLQATFEVCTRGPVAGPLYPDGAGLAGSAVCGWFRWHVIDRAAGTDTPYVPGEQWVFPSEAGAPGSNAYTDQLHVSYCGSLTAGTYDFVLVYHLGATPSTLQQIDVSRVSVVGEAF